MLGERLRIARKKAGLSLRELAAIMEPPVTAQAISKYEANEMMPSSRVLVGLGKALGVSLDFLMSGEVEELAGIEFRKHSGASARDRARVEAIVTEALEDYLAVEARHRNDACTPLKISHSPRACRACRTRRTTPERAPRRRRRRRGARARAPRTSPEWSWSMRLYALST